MRTCAAGTMHGDRVVLMKRYENLAVRVLRAPQGVPRPDDFRVDTIGTPAPEVGEVLFRACYLSIDPSARRRLPSATAGNGPLGEVAAIGDVVLAGVVPAQSGLDGALVGEVVESRHPRFRQGDLVRGGNAWQIYHTVPGDYLDKLAPRPETPLASELGVLGRPGFAAYCGLRFASTVRPGSTVLISAAGGAVGMMAGQLAALAGARVVGIASGDKPAYVTHELGFADCVDRTAETITEGLDRTCPDGVDLYFDNVGGPALQSIFDRLNNFGQVVVCGMASEYNEPESAYGPPLRPVLRKRLRVQGFVVHDHYDEYPRFRDQALELVADGRLRYREDVIGGIDNAPRALANVLTGRNAGKQLVRLGPPPAQFTRQ